MTNEQKADKLSKKGFKDFNNPYIRATIAHVKECCLDMAQWKDEQYNEEKKELLVLVNMLSIDEHSQTIIEDLKALLQ